MQGACVAPLIQLLLSHVAAGHRWRLACCSAAGEAQQTTRTRRLLLAHERTHAALLTMHAAPPQAGNQSPMSTHRVLGTHRRPPRRAHAAAWRGARLLWQFVEAGCDAGAGDAPAVAGDGVWSCCQSLHLEEVASLVYAWRLCGSRDPAGHLAHAAAVASAATLQVCMERVQLSRQVRLHPISTHARRAPAGIHRRRSGLRHAAAPPPHTHTHSLPLVGAALCPRQQLLLGLIIIAAHV
jgi:hypothetical protein